ncbi:MAG: PTS sugar transporter subunit IIB [Culicoidibacterales bacterium]
MTRIKLFCAGGMSTSMLVNKMKEAAHKQGIEVEIAAYPETDIANQVAHCDVVLLGPQVGYCLTNVQNVCEPYKIPCGVIPMVDYGMMNGEKVLEFARSLATK